MAKPASYLAMPLLTVMSMVEICVFMAVNGPVVKKGSISRKLSPKSPSATVSQLPTTVVTFVAPVAHVPSKACSAARFDPIMVSNQGWGVNVLAPARTCAARASQAVAKVCPPALNM